MILTFLIAEYGFYINFLKGVNSYSIRVNTICLLLLTGLEQMPTPL